LDRLHLARDVEKCHVQVVVGGRRLLPVLGMQRLELVVGEVDRSRSRTVTHLLR
jgi:hypothetical protein